MARADPVNPPNGWVVLAPGIALAVALAVCAETVAPVIARVAPVPSLVIALVIGIWLHPIAARSVFLPGLRFCVSTILRLAVALLGLRVALGDIAALGFAIAIIVVVGMAVTLVSGFWIARAFGLSKSFGALAGCATAVCGASAALATSSVLPSYPGKEADTVFVIVAVNLLSTAAMLVYPPISMGLGLSETATGALLGGSIHDVAQVVGAGFAVSDRVGTAAVIVKLFRVLLLLPVILLIGKIFADGKGRAKVPFPAFALTFLGLCLVNSLISYAPDLIQFYGPVKSFTGSVSTWGLLVAIAGLGLSTSIASFAQLGARHVATVTGTTVIILAVIAGGLVFVT